ncbi:MAG: electron transfer flavoprotein beta subunit/FixA family protein [Chitinophagales bacterium]|nr:electron transfer flavoprotein beta subunit/FixA family protein [Bacteroidota bacterium]MCB9042411.1 electron transfer flavoprotein beta subunit/FixA family protein [Chitinophagales bacterium]
MKILVCLSKVPDTTTKISFTDNNTKFNAQGVTWILNPTDEWYALVRALEIVEQQGGSVTVIHVGNAEGDQLIRKALAIGANDAVRIDVEPQDAFQAAANIAQYAAQQSYDLIMTGKETINYNGAIVGGIIAEILELPYVSLASSLDVNGSTATMKCEIEGGEETVEASLPLVVSANKGMAEQRIPNMRGIMTARTKPLSVIPAFANTQTQVEVVKFEAPPTRGNVHLVDPDNMDELVRLLHDEAKVI